MSTVPTPNAGGPSRPADVPLPDRLKHLPVDARGYPIIVTVPQEPGAVDFGAISEARKLVMATYDLCAVCGYPFVDPELRWQVQFATKQDLVNEDHDGRMVQTNEAPVHKICSLYAAQVCPFVSSPYARLSDQMRRGQRRGDVLALRGFRTTADVKAIPSDLQTGVNILMFEMEDLVETITLNNAAEARQAYQAALKSDGPVKLDDATACLVDQLSTPVDGEDASGVLAGGAYLVGAAFLDGVTKVQGMHRFDRPDRSFLRIAAALAHDPTSADGLIDPHLVAAIRWLNTRVQLPMLLDRWRERGRRTMRIVRDRNGAPAPAAPRPARRGADQGARRRKAQRAARRRHRR